MGNRLTRKEWDAIIEALTSRLAGEIDISEEEDSPALEDYESALDKVIGRGTPRPPDVDASGLIHSKPNASEGKVNLDLTRALFKKMFEGNKA